MPGVQITYILSGGPCDGKIGQISPSIAQSGEVTCKQHVYKRGDPVVVTGGHVVFKDTGRVQPPPETATAAHTHHGWHDLRVSINHNLPAALRKAKKSQAAALRSLARGRKVHR